MHTGSGTRVLVVDDNDHLAGLICWFLQRRGFDAASSPSFAAARDELSTRPPQVLISDIELEHESAKAELPKLSREGLLPPTLVVSGRLEEGVVEELHAIPQVRAVLPKPFDFELLERGVMNCLETAAAEAAAAGRPVGAGESQRAGTAVSESSSEGWTEITPSAS